MKFKLSSYNQKNSTYKEYPAVGTVSKNIDKMSWIQKIVGVNKTKSSARKTSEFINKEPEANDLKIVYSDKNLEFFINNS